MTLKSPRLSIDEKQMFIAEYLQSPMSLKAYAKDKGVGMSTVGKWAHEVGMSLKKERVKGKESVTISSSSLSQSRPLFVDVTACMKELQISTAPLSMVVTLTGGATLTLPQLSADQALGLVKGLLSCSL